MCDNMPMDKSDVTCSEARIIELTRWIKCYQFHSCSSDEYEGGGCPVCSDIECMEAELSGLKGKV